MSYRVDEHSLRTEAAWSGGSAEDHSVLLTWWQQHEQAVGGMFIVFEFPLGSAQAGITDAW